MDKLKNGSILIEARLSAERRHQGLSSKNEESIEKDIEGMASELIKDEGKDSEVILRPS